MSRSTLVALSVLVLGSLPAAASAQLLPITPGIFAYVDASEPANNSYTPANTRRSGLGGSVKISHATNQPGLYSVVIGTLEIADGGNFQVAAYGDDDAYCILGVVVDFAVTKSASVICRNGAGELVNSKFTLTYAHYGLGWLPETSVGYATIETDGSVDTYEGRTHNSAVGNVVASRALPGTYLVRFFGQTGVSPHFRVTAYSWAPRYCKLAVVGADIAGVYCFDENGSPADTAFTIAYDNRNTFYGLTEAHVQSDETGNVETNEYTEGATSPSAPVVEVIKHWTTNGQYSVFFTHLASETILGVPHVTAIHDGSSVNLSKRCKAVSFERNADLVTVRVDCRLENGTLSNSSFSVSFVR